MELEPSWDTFDPFLYCSRAWYSIVTGVTLNTREKPGVMQQPVFCGLYRKRIEPAAL